ncbi:DUF5134 domain-containing protein [Nocardioides sp. KR10-350]|uniref:DUF5134 domain-containing protein n=1 Tax=Nocardioides cheoyonin TaxID=3156615 RepID=UPI0032B5AD06
MGDPGTVVAAALTAVATGYCVVRCLLPRIRCSDAAHDGPWVDLWHVVMGAAMVVMLLWPVRGHAALVQVAAFALGALWFACSALALRWAGGRVRLAATSAVMALMLVPAAWAGPASAAEPMGEMAGMAGMDMPGMAHSGGDAAMVMPPAWLGLVLLGVTTAVIVEAVLAGLRDRRPGARLGAACEVVMTGSMAYMALLAL